MDARPSTRMRGGLACNACSGRLGILPVGLSGAGTVWRDEMSDKLRELIAKHEYVIGACLCGAYKMPPYTEEDISKYPFPRDVRWALWAEHFATELKAALAEPADEMQVRSWLKRKYPQIEGLNADIVIAIALLRSEAAKELDKKQ